MPRLGRVLRLVSAWFPLPLQPVQHRAQRLKLGLSDVLLHFGELQNFHDLLHFIEGFPQSACDVLNLRNGLLNRGGRSGLMLPGIFDGNLGNCFAPLLFLGPGPSAWASPARGTPGKLRAWWLGGRGRGWRRLLWFGIF